MAEGGLVADGLTRSYGPRRVVEKVDLTVAPGEVVGLLGPNGAGKSTTFGMLAGIVRPDAGRVWLDDKELTALPLYRRARLGLGYLAQDASVFRGLSVEENLGAVLELRRDLRRPERRARAAQLIDDFDLGGVAKSRGEQLSGGERRRVEIARCLAMDPRIILLDEPFAGIDPLAVGELQTVLGGLAQRGLGLLMTDHNVRETLGTCHRVYVIVEGRILAEGSREEIASHPLARGAYLGMGFSLP